MIKGKFNRECHTVIQHISSFQFIVIITPLPVQYFIFSVGVFFPLLRYMIYRSDYSILIAYEISWLFFFCFWVQAEKKNRITVKQTDTSLIFNRCTKFMQSMFLYSIARPFFTGNVRL